MRSLRWFAAGLPAALLLAGCGSLSGTSHLGPPLAVRPAVSALGGLGASAVTDPAAPLDEAGERCSPARDGDGRSPCAWDDYPFRAAPMTAMDPWSFPYRQCTSFAAYRVNERGTKSGVAFGRVYLGRYFGDARWWDDAAREAGLAVLDEPAVGRVAQWERFEGGAGEWGHVAYVAAVFGPGDILVEEYNWARGAYTQRRITAGGGFWPSHFLEL